MKTNRRPPLLSLVFVLLVMLLSSACNMPTSKPAGLRLEPRTDDGSLSGSFRYSSEMGGEMIQFSVDADGLASFRMEGASEADTLTVDLSDAETVHLSWQGARLDGFGALSEDEGLALANLSDSQLAHALAMIPLDVACQGEAAADPKQVAALLYPLQMLFKYQIADRAAVASELAALSQCDYGTRTDVADRYPTVILMTPASPVPVVLGYFPFDDVGVEQVSTTGEAGLKLACLDPSYGWGSGGYAAGARLSDGSLLGFEIIRDEYGPCQSKCRGACGADCTINNCKLSVEDRCEKDEDGKNNGFKSKIFSYDCGLHPACIQHDHCYDDCNRRFGCDSWAAAYCMHGGVFDWTAAMVSLLGINISCDKTTLNEEELANVMDWVQGYGPQPIRQTFEYSDKPDRFDFDPIKCPTEGDEQDIESDQDASSGPLGTYKGTGQYTNVKILLSEQLNNDVVITLNYDWTLSGSINFSMRQFYTVDGCIETIERFTVGTISGEVVFVTGKTYKGDIEFAGTDAIQVIQSCGYAANEEISTNKIGTITFHSDNQMNGHFTDFLKFEGSKP
jgi:hypothetical protein